MIQKWVNFEKYKLTDKFAKLKKTIYVKNCSTKSQKLMNKQKVQKFAVNSQI